jgi:hypothetical protein
VLPLGAGALVAALPAPPAARETARGRGAPLLRATLRPGIGLALVNVGYVAVLAFGAAVGRAHGAAAAGLVVPVFAATVIAARLLGAGVPDRLGAVTTLRACVLAEGLGLAALARIEPERHGAAAGLFFSWFDAGVGLGGPLVGALARATGPATAVALAGAAVASVAAQSPRTRRSGCRAPARGRRGATPPPGPAPPVRCPGRSR